MADGCKVYAQTPLTIHGGLKVEGQQRTCFNIFGDKDITIEGKLKVTGKTSKQTVVQLIDKGIVKLGSDVVVTNAKLDLSHKQLMLKKSARVTASGDAVIRVKKGTNQSGWIIGPHACVEEV